MPKYKLIIHHDVEFEAKDLKDAEEMADDVLGESIEGDWERLYYTVEELNPIPKTRKELFKDICFRLKDLNLRITQIDIEEIR